MNRILSFIAFSTLLAAGRSPQEGDELRHSLDRLGRGALDDGALGLALAIDTGGEIVFAGGWGAAAGHDAQAGPDTPFVAGPLLGSFLAVVALRLVERDELALATPLSELVPGLYAGHPEITLDRLLTHTSGIPPYGDLLVAQHRQAAAFEPEPILAWLKGSPLDSEPGTCAEYSSTNDFLVGLALEKAGEARVAELLAREVFAPCGMEDTGWRSEGSERHASAHLDQEFGGGETELVDAPPPFDADDLHSTVLDLVRFQRALAGGKLLEASARELRLAAAELADGSRAAYARGISLTALEELPRQNAGGGMAGQRVHLAHYPTMDTTIAVLASGPDAPLEALERSAARLVFDLQPAVVRDQPLGAAERALYVGEYYAGCTSYGITEANGRLVLVPPSGERRELLYQGDGRFLARDDTDLSLVFELDDDRAIALVLSEHGVSLRAVRVV
jgi:CubicO group peptidase (beta-lactamase class C family)